MKCSKRLVDKSSARFIDVDLIDESASEEDAINSDSPWNNDNTGSSRDKSLI